MARAIRMLVVFLGILMGLYIGACTAIYVAYYTSSIPVYLLPVTHLAAFTLIIRRIWTRSGSGGHFSSFIWFTFLFAVVGSGLSLLAIGIQGILITGDQGEKLASFWEPLNSTSRIPPWARENSTVDKYPKGNEL